MKSFTSTVKTHSAGKEKTPGQRFTVLMILAQKTISNIMETNAT